MAMTRFRYLVNDILHLSCEYPANLPVAVISKATWSRTTTTAAAPFIHDDDDGGFDNIFCNQEIREMEEGQRVIIGTVATIADLVEEAGIKNHATAVFGYSVTALRGGGDAIDDGGNLNGFEQETRWEEGGCIIEMKRNKKSIH